MPDANREVEEEGSETTQRSDLREIEHGGQYQNHAGYGDATRDAYSRDLRQWLGWCARHDLRVFEVKRAHIELFARSLEHDGKARATVARRLSTIAGFYRYCVEESS